MRILMVDDEKPLTETVRLGLAQQRFLGEVAHDGVTGLWLPLKNGYDVLRELRAGKIWTPVLMLTAKDGEYDQTDAFDLGADDYLTKPVSFLVLVARLRALIRRAPLIGPSSSLPHRSRRSTRARRRE